MEDQLFDTVNVPFGRCWFRSIIFE